jgi:hypothetical protein
MEVAMVFILTQFIGPIGVILKNLRYCVSTWNNELSRDHFGNGAIQITVAIPSPQQSNSNALAHGK